MKKIRVALVQMRAETDRKEKNLARIAAFAREAAKTGAEIVCFPELCVPGYNRERAGAAAEAIPGESSLALSRLARENGLVILAGMAEKPGPEGSLPFNTQVVAHPDGRLERYRKTHLGKSERSFFLPGDSFPVFATGKARFAVEICWDLHFPEVTAIYALRGAEIIFAPHASPSFVGDRREIWLKYLPARAYDNSLFVAACNLTGEDGGQAFCGGAVIIDPKGNVLAESFPGKEDLLVADLDPGLLNAIRGGRSPSMRYSFFLAQRRPELYGELAAEGGPPLSSPAGTERR
jgi:predicted amidohydrolase